MSITLLALALGIAVDAYLNALRRYFDFSGRSSRSQFWMFQLVMLLFIVVAVEIDLLRGNTFGLGQYGQVTDGVILFHFVPQWSVSIRRLHDVGKSGWWYLVSLLPFGGLWLLYLQCCSSEPGTNDYGEDPRDIPPPPEYAPPSGIARVSNLSRPAPLSSVRAAATGTQPRGFGLRH